MTDIKHQNCDMSVTLVSVVLRITVNNPKHLELEEFLRPLSSEEY